jgi:hypothetical protein
VASVCEAVKAANVVGIWLSMKQIHWRPYINQRMRGKRKVKVLMSRYVSVSWF